ncbi:MAG: ECF-type sigma factor [Planctomycetota bacterium]
MTEDDLRTLLAWLERRASKHLRGYPANLTIDTVGLVNEAVIRILRNNLLERSVRPAYLYGAAGRAVREALADFVRKKKRLKNGAGFHRINIFDHFDQASSRHADLLDLHHAIEALKAHDQFAAEVVNLKFYVGWTIKQIAAELEVSDFTVEKSWRNAKRFLRRYLSADS